MFRVVLQEKTAGLGGSVRTVHPVNSGRVPRIESLRIVMRGRSMTRQFVGCRTHTAHTG